MQIDFDFTSVTRMAARYQDGPRIVIEEARRGITRSVIMVQNDARIAAPVDTGRLRNSIAHEVTTSGRDVIGRTGTNVQYAPFVEDGRRAGAPMPPEGSLAGWIRRHGIDARAEFAVRRAISRRGIRPRPYLKPALAKNRVEITREMDHTLRRIAQRLAGGR